MDEELDENDIDMALEALKSEMNMNEDIKPTGSPFVPGPEAEDDLLLEVKEINMEDEILALMRAKRSIAKKEQGHGTNNDTVKFFNAVDELNEDTLKKLNVSGTLPAHKVGIMPQISRRTNILNNSSSALHIEYSKTKQKGHHDDNKVDTLAIHDDKEDLLVHSKAYGIMGNHSQGSKDKELSKILVNELKGGTSETIGDKNAPVISNITFTPENDTLTAMAFIAGNLLNKLWNMEKDANDDRIDTEVLKHEKIADLLELFKEPMSMRQELFLKSTLEQLSTAINKNKDVGDITLCKTIKENQQLVSQKENKSKDHDQSDCDNVQEKSKTTTTSEALAKINEVLNLIKKYENVQKNLSDMKSGNMKISQRSNTKNPENTLTKDEQSSLDLYGKTLETITKLLVPKKKNKKLVKSIKNSNLFAAGNSLEKTLSDINLGNVNVTAKDKMLLDYLAHIQSNPDCLLKKPEEKATMQHAIEGNILLNLSEFFKIKSLSDLVKQVETEKLTVTDKLVKSDRRLSPPLLLQTTTTQKPVQKETTETIVKHNLKQLKDASEKTIDSIEKHNLNQVKDIKEKLKGHLKSILEDLMELQNITDKGTKSKDIKIIEALPCIYNLISTGKKEITTPLIALEDDKLTSTGGTRLSDRVHEIFSNLKKELQFAQTRRTNSVNEPRPKSAIVWERVIKNAEGKQKHDTRRNLGIVPKTIEELKIYLEKIDTSGSNSYKNYAFLYEVPPAERLLLLKTFNADTMKNMRGLEAIMATLQAKSGFTSEVKKYLNEFIDNVAISINLNEKVIRNLDKPKKAKSLTYVFDPKKQIRNKPKAKLQQLAVPKYDSKLSRDQIVNQLIKNRIQLYVDTKEAARETANDINYDIAKQILLLLNIGKSELARELYKVFAVQKQKDPTIVENSKVGVAKEQTNRYGTQRRPKVEPLIKFEDTKTTKMINQDHFIKQLLNLKNMKL